METAIVSHQIMPDRGIRMDLSLNDHGVAIIQFQGSTVMNCWCGRTHNYKVKARLHGDTSMDTMDMDDLEGALRGDDDHAQRFGWRLIHKMFFVETPPCERSARVPQ